MDWQRFKNIHQDSTIIVCGCGSSLTSLKQPGHYITIGVNDVERLFTPNYLVALNPPHQYKLGRYHYVQHSRCKYVFSQLLLPVKYSQLVKTPLGLKAGTDFPQESGIHYTQNSPYFAVCLAALMGAKRIGLIGVDLTENHFFAKTGHHVLQKKSQQIDQEYGALHQSLQRKGVELINLSQSSALTSLPKQSLQSFDTRETDLLQGSMSSSESICDNGFKRNKRSTINNKPMGKKNVVAVKQALNIVHVGLTNCAGALWNLHNMLNRYTPHRSRVVTASQITNGRRYPKDVLLSEKDKVHHLLASADIVHFHNWLDKDSPQMKPFWNVLNNKPAVLQYHSEPEVLKHAFPGRDLLTRDDITTLVVAQKQARFFPNAIAVPNAVDIHNTSFKLTGTRQEIRRRNRLKVLFAPTDTRSYPDHSMTCRGKGFLPTVKILKDLEQQKRLRAFIVTNKSWQKLNEIRHQVDWVIDECVTGGYHLTSLEALAQGCVACAYLDQKTIQILSSISGSASSELPWINTPIDLLHETLTQKSNCDLAQLKMHSRRWMEKYWAPEAVLTHYTQAYYQEIYGQSQQALPLHPIHTKSQLKTDLTPLTLKQKPLKTLHYKLPGKMPPKTSDEFPQTVSLSSSILALKNSWSNNTCHIIGNGPSINATDLSLLAEQKLITVNATSLLHKNIGRDADFYCVSDRRFLADKLSLRFLNAAKQSHHVFAGYCDNFVQYKEIDYVRIRRGDGISANIELGFHHNCSVVLFASQLALFLGCKNIFWHGCEFHYKDGRFNADYTRPHDTNTFPRVKSAATTLAKWLLKKGGKLTVVGPSKLTGEFGESPIPTIQALTLDAFHQEFLASKQLTALPSK